MEQLTKETQMSKTGIVAYILAAIFVGCCFWIVGCSTEDCSSTEMPTNGGEGEECIDSFYPESSSSETNSSSSEVNE